MQLQISPGTWRIETSNSAFDQITTVLVVLVIIKLVLASEKCPESYNNVSGHQQSSSGNNCPVDGAT